MKSKCHKCGSEGSRKANTSMFEHRLPEPNAIYEIQTENTCINCGASTGGNHQFFQGQKNLPKMENQDSSESNLIKRKMVHIFAKPEPRRMISIQYEGVYQTDDNVTFPVMEGTIQDGTVIDKYGDPDLVAEIAKAYLDDYTVLMENRRFPTKLSQMMPVIQLLVISVELAMKAYFIRSEKEGGSGHSLVALYDDLDEEFREHLERDFANSELVSQLSGLGDKRLTVREILYWYGDRYGGQSYVYMDSKYYAEPTTKFKKQSNVHGANLVKGQTPYPIFLPEVVNCLLKTYEYYSGAERLKRLGGDIQIDKGENGQGSHGEWGLIPSTLGLVVVSIPQNNNQDPRGEELDTFRDFIANRPPLYRADWMYGGSVNLFYPSAKNENTDGSKVIDGIECEIWLKRRIRLHTRDLYFLAEILETAEANATK